MTDKDLHARAIALHDSFTHDHHDRRAFLADLTRLAGSAAAANALAAAIAANPAAAAIIPADDTRLKTGTTSWNTANTRKMAGYWASPAKPAGPLPAVIVIHENRGLNDHIRDVARRVALEGFHAIAPDFLSPAGGTPADEAQAREMIGTLDLAAAVQDGAATVRMIKADKKSNGKAGVIGFCWGGAMTNRIAVAAGSALGAAVPYYGPCPDPAEAAKVKAPMLLQFAATDDRVNKTAEPWIAALKAAKVPVQAYFYEGTHHAFNNDTSAERYNKAAADLAWGRTIAFLKKNLA
ncbi:carboxymethylenebutenolidase [Sphingomonas laterariae]|uniref:Carboxymethylenebutenolidase n=1 Tax=Edaphosphingomonas laterariae TaxID=861865 RepID=A0A239DK58_9SPHN|nr:dienelactone hydrolase family protein [Sphingomonas laterariae]SNS32826.1 carboxymethylenebutenolidase [Sphingomonas laterariae]